MKKLNVTLGDFIGMDQETRNMKVDFAMKEKT
jgi:hypothetical protein